MHDDEILAHPARLLTDEQRRAYLADGYVAAEGLVDDRWLSRLREATAEIVERSRAVTRSDGQYLLEDGHRPDAPRLRRLSSPVVHHPVFWEFASAPDSPLPDVAADVVGPHVKFHHAKLNFKWAGGGSPFDWHQDIQAWPHTNYTPCTIGLYLEPCGPEQGPLACVRGSHDGPLHSMRDEHGDWVLRVPAAEMAKIPPAQIDHLGGPAGTLVLLNCRTIHGSAANHSPRPRPFLLNVFSSADAFPYTANPLPTPYAGAIVRGEAARWAHHDPRPCEIPPDWSGGYVGPWQHQQAAPSAGG